MTITDNRAGGDRDKKLVPNKDLPAYSAVSDSDFEGEDDPAYRCGCGHFRPDWLQRFATSRFYGVVFGLLGISQGAYRAYMVGTLSSVEKRFSISSRVSSVILVADDFSPLLATVVFLVFLRRTSMPNWISGGMLLSLVGALASYLPYAIFGAGTHLLEHPGGTPGSLGATPLQFCTDSDRGSDYQRPSDRCTAHYSDWSTIGAVVLLFLGNFLNGLGGVACYVVGTTYMDDNVKKKNSALYFADSGITPQDPRWIGAWWMGYLVLAACLFVSALPVALFPRKLRRSQKGDASEQARTSPRAPRPSIRDELKGAIQVLKRLARNPVYVYRTLGNIAVYIALTGYYITFPKYTQHQFQQTTSRASLFTGPTVIVSNMVGTFAGAIFVHKWQPRPRIIAWHNVVVTLLATVGIAALMAVDCGTLRYPSTTDHETGSSTLENACTMQCSCSTNVHRPVCDTSNGIQYFSPCFAGCAPQSSNKSIFNDCHCLVATSDYSTFHNGDVTYGKCEQDCSAALMAFSVVVFVIQVCYSTTLVGSTLLVIRSLDAQDKRAALSMLSAIMNMFAFIPYPLIYGALADASCLLWEDKCGERGACWLYDLPKFRFILHGVTAALLIVGCVFQGVVVHYSDRVAHFYDDYPEVENHSSAPSALPLVKLRAKEVCANEDPVA
ncbi:solute carrier organic anion transporter family member 74D-like isoform X2 [Haemaphysalis longicornis]